MLTKCIPHMFFDVPKSSFGRHKFSKHFSFVSDIFGDLSKMEIVEKKGTSCRRLVSHVAGHRPPTKYRVHNQWLVPDALFSDPFSQKGASVQCSDQIAVSGDTPVPSMGWGVFCFNDRLLVAWFGSIVASQNCAISCPLLNEEHPHT